MRMVRTGNNYVRCEQAGRKWYQPILDLFGYRMRLSKRKFKRAQEASDYQEQVLARLKRMRNGR